MDDLTPRQREVLDCIAAHLESHGYPPTLRELAACLKVNGTLGVAKHLKALEKKGYLERSAGDSRGIALRHRPDGLAQLPIVGTVRAGALQPAMEDIEGHFAIDAGRTRKGDFFLRVRGDSMIDAGILDGDLVQVRPQASADDGDVVVALVDDEATLKRFFREGGAIRLQPENPALEPVIVRPQDGEVRLVGRLVGLFRSF